MFLNTYSFRQTLKLKTPEGISFYLPIAGFFSRFLALILDQAIIIIAITLVSTIARIAGVLSADFALSFIIFMQFVISTGYNILLEWIWNGQTFGKKVMKIQVVDQLGMKLGFSQVVVRNLIRIVDMLPMLYGVGSLSAMASPLNKRLGDIAANTLIVSIKKQVVPDFDQIAPEKFNSLRERLGIIAKIKSQCNNDIAYISFHAILRRNEFEPDSRIKVFKALSEYFKKIIGSELEDINSLSDERLVKNIVEVLFDQNKNQSN